MAFITSTPPEHADGDVRAMYQRQQDAFGYVPNYARVFCHRPEVMERWAALSASIRRHMDRRRFELVTLAAAHALGNRYCALAHADALGAFHSRDEILALVGGSEDAPLSAAEMTMTAFARQVAVDATAVTAEDVDALRRHGFHEAEIFDIAATAAARAFFTKLLDALGAEPDAAYGAMDPALVAALTARASRSRAS
ncbi:MAG: carboxymuconolactone decarboxylase family protein [Pseudomonadota bacterium]